jgi:hypothetical protein
MWLCSALQRFDLVVRAFPGACQDLVMAVVQEVLEMLLQVSANVPSN